jgi:purine-nucleoside/S-methyl-5'-thioadenosine phosphorylase / adenosine deaminase
VDAKLIDWDAPGPYRLAFSTRLGGVSEGPFRSLNLGMFTDDEPDRVVENRRRLCAAVAANAELAAMAWQQHGARVLEAAPTGIVTPGVVFEQGDGLWSSEPGQPIALLTADCLPVAVCRTEGEPALCILHVGWRGLLAGIVGAGTESLGDGPLAAVIGPGIGPCCYEVGEEVARPYRAAFGEDVVVDRRLDLWTATERALSGVGCDSVERTDLCTACDPELFFSHRRDGGRTGRQGVIGYVE